jgi:hypothetical protein
LTTYGDKLKGQSVYDSGPASLLFLNPKFIDSYSEEAVLSIADDEAVISISSDESLLSTSSDEATITITSNDSTISISDDEAQLCL